MNAIKNIVTSSQIKSEFIRGLLESYLDKFVSESGPLLRITIIFTLIATMTFSCAFHRDYDAIYMPKDADLLKGKLSIDIENDGIIGDVIYRHLLKEEEKENGLEFYISIDFDIQEVSGIAVESYEIIKDTTTYIGKFLKKINITINSAQKANQVVDFKFKYSGTIDLKGFAKLDYPTTWIEVSPNTLILTPAPIDFPKATYKLDLEVSGDYQVICPGEVLEKVNDVKFIDSQVPIRGVYFIISKALDIENVSFSSTNITLASYNIPQSMKDRICELTGVTIDYYNNIFGNTLQQSNVTIVLRPSDKWDGSFAAGTNYFVSYDCQSDFEEKEEGYYIIYAHEIAHFWWKDAEATTNSNWLNEGFAEFSGCLAVKSLYGTESFQKRLLEHKNVMDKVPPGINLSNFERFGEHEEAVAYSGGALLLNEIYQSIGEEEFFKLMRSILKADVKTNSEFIEFMKNYGDAKWIDRTISRIQGN